MNTLITWLFTAIQYTVVILMAPLTLAVCAGLLVCTYLITRQLGKPAARRRSHTHESYEWIKGPTSEWLGA
jgi:hypothetical protein